MAARRGGGAAVSVSGGGGGASRVKFVGRTPAELGARLRGAQPKIRRATADGLEDTGRTLGRLMVNSGAAAMPSRNGLASIVRRSTIRVAPSGVVGGRTTRIDVSLSSPDGVDLSRLDAGELRHPVWGRAPWVSQVVPSGRFTRPAIGIMPTLRDNVSRRVNSAIRTIT